MLLQVAAEEAAPSGGRNGATCRHKDICMKIVNGRSAGFVNSESCVFLEEGFRQFSFPRQSLRASIGTGHCRWMLDGCMTQVAIGATRASGSDGRADCVECSLKFADGVYDVAVELKSIIYSLRQAWTYSAPCDHAVPRAHLQSLHCVSP